MGRGLAGGASQSSTVLVVMVVVGRKLSQELRGYEWFGVNVV